MVLLTLFHTELVVRDSLDSNGLLALVEPSFVFGRVWHNKVLVLSGQINDGMDFRSLRGLTYK